MHVVSLTITSDAASAKATHSRIEELQLIAYLLVRFSSLDDTFQDYITHRQKFEHRHHSQLAYRSRAKMFARFFAGVTAHVQLVHT